MNTCTDCNELVRYCRCRWFARRLSFAALLALAGCSPPNKVTDAQVAEVAAQCKAAGMTTRIFNGATSLVECVPIEVKK